MIATKIKTLLGNGFVWGVIALLLWLWSERRVEEARLLARAECQRQVAEQAQKSAEQKNKRITKNVQQKLEILSGGDVGFDILLELMRSGKM